jgi:hypothetical protein
VCLVHRKCQHTLRPERISTRVQWEGRLRLHWVTNSLLGAWGAGGKQLEPREWNEGNSDSEADEGGKRSVATMLLLAFQLVQYHSDFSIISFSKPKANSE